MRRLYIHIVDKQDRWRKLAVKTLRRAGYRVTDSPAYEDAAATNGYRPYLVVLGCARIGEDEKEQIRKIIAQQQPLLVLCARLSFDEVRSLYLMGVDETADKHHEPALIVKAVKNVLLRVAREYISL